jgi:prevent-host-death family protein
MSHVFNVHEAKSQLSKLIALAQRGEPVVIAKDGVPVVRLVSERTGVPVFGAGRIGGAEPVLSDDAFAPMSDAEELKLWGH